MNVKSKALIIGGTGGIGSALSSYFKKTNYDVTTTSSIDFDLSDENQVFNWLDKFKPTPQVLICNAGVNKPETIDNLLLPESRKIMEINYFSHSMILKYFARKMALNNFGRIIVISSAYSKRYREGRSAYSASKSALEAFSKTLAIEYARFNILINCIAPGFINTELTRKNNDDNQINRICSQIPIGRLGEAEELTDLIGFLVSVKNTYITGQTIDVDGGYSLI